jgi:DNA-binding response OmpR family regulator
MLLVEDDQAIGQAIGQALAAGGFTVLHCTCADEALAALDHDAPDVVLVDMLLPGAQARHVVAALRAAERFRATPVVFITARGAPHDTHQFQALQALATIPDLFDPVTYSTTAAVIWERWASGQAAEVGG